MIATYWARASSIHALHDDVLLLWEDVAFLDRIQIEDSVA